MTRHAVPEFTGECWTTTGAHRLVRGDVVKARGAAKSVVLSREDISGYPVGSVRLTLAPTEGGENVSLALRATAGVLIRCDELYRD
jgi:hypothetical protein